MVTQLHTLWCYTTNMSRSIEFYRDLLGFTVDQESPYWSSLSLGGIRFGLHPHAPSQEPVGAGLRGWFVGLQTDDLKGLRRRLEAAGVTIPGDYHDIPGGVVLDVLDPDGNVVELGQMGISAADLT